jgi:hypothetical protein
MKTSILLISLCFYSLLTWATHVEYAELRKAKEKFKLKKDSILGVKLKRPKDYKQFYLSDIYRLDLNFDGLLDGIQVKKVEQKDYVSLYDQNNKQRAQFELEGMGIDSYLYRVRVRKVNHHTSLVLLYYYEGYSSGKEFYASGRVYFVTIKDNKFEQIHFQKGPSLFIEQDKVKNKYYARSYDINLVDLNGDNSNEITVHNKSLVRTYILDEKQMLWRAL